MVDSYFEIGTSHIVCQDYAIHGEFNGMKYGIVSDGCSTAEHSEIGAQVLCHVAKHYVTLFYHSGMFKECSIETLSSVLGNSILKRADDLRKLYPIIPAALQATLLVTVSAHDMVFLFAWGDGIIIECYEDPKLDIITKIDYSANAPFYLVSDELQYRDFVSEKGIEPDKIITTIYDNHTNSIETRTESHPFQKAYTFSYCKDLCASRMRSITLCTDGLLSYRDHDKCPIDYIDFISEFTQFKSTTGEFVKRRMKFFEKRLKNNQWSHYDDVATATILL